MPNTKNEYDQTQLSLIDIHTSILKYTIPAAAHPNKNYYSTEATRVMAALSLTCKTMYGIFKPELDKRAAEPLLRFILQPSKAAVEAVVEMAITNPKLFFVKTTTIDYAMDLEGNRRLIKDWSPYQALFGTGDVALLANVKPFLDKYLAAIPNGEQLALQQELEKFPNGFDFPPSTYDFGPLATAIRNDEQLRQTNNPNEATLLQLMQFRKDYQPSVVMMGHHFNMNDVICAHEIYKQYWDTWNANQGTFFSLHVIGFLERLMTGFYLQSACGGFVNGNMRFNRNFTVKDDETNKWIKVAPHDHDLSCRLGRDFVVDSYHGRWTVEPWVSWGCMIYPILPSLWKARVSEYSKVVKTNAYSNVQSGFLFRDCLK